VNNDELGLRWGYFRVFSNPDLLYQEYLIGSAIVDKWQLNIKFIKNSDAAFFCRLFIKYELLDDGIWKPGIKQIPIYMRIDPILYRDTWYLVDYNFEDLDVLYPSIENPDNLSDYVSLADGKYSILYDGWFTYQALKSIGKNRPPSSVKITGMYAVLNQIDKNYYYNFMANSRANKSVRLDEQLLLSNIKKEGGSGTGFIGSVTTDTLFYNVWYYYVKKLFYIDGQKYSKQ
jgi:hypothetical protein